MRAQRQPDRMALWAVLLGVILVLAAATSSHAATRARVQHARTAHVIAAPATIRSAPHR
jgi:hypothetical protein